MTGLRLRIGRRDAFGPAVGFAGAARARLRFPFLEIGAQFLGEPLLAVDIAAGFAGDGRLGGHGSVFGWRGAASGEEIRIIVAAQCPTKPARNASHT